MVFVVEMFFCKGFRVIPLRRLFFLNFYYGEAGSLWIYVSSTPCMINLTRETQSHDFAARTLPPQLPSQHPKAPATAAGACVRCGDKTAPPSRAARALGRLVRCLAVQEGGHAIGGGARPSQDKPAGAACSQVSGGAAVLPCVKIRTWSVYLSGD